MITLDKVESDGEIIPAQAEICASLDDISIVPLIINKPHYDSLHDDHGCAAMDMTLKEWDFNSEDFMRFINPDERALILEAAARSLDEANLVLLKLTNIPAFTNYHNDVRAHHGLPPLKRVGITALYDTRTMGLELRAPVLIKSPGSEKLILAPADRPVIKTTNLANELKEIIAKQKDSNLPKFGSFRDTFNKADHFAQFSREITRLAVSLYDPKLEIKDEKDQIAPLFNIPTDFRERIENFINLHFGDLNDEQAKALTGRLLITIADQYYKGLSQIEEHHPFSEHDERYISVSQDSKFVGKYDVDDQNFIISVPDPKIAEKRIDIGAQVMDTYGVDNGKAHLLFIATSVNKVDFESRKLDENGSNYKTTLNTHKQLFRDICRENKIKARITNGNLLPIGIILNNETGELLEIVTEDYWFL